MQKVETEGDEQMQTQENFRNLETNEPLQTIESVGEQFNLIKNISKSEEGLGAEIIKKDKTASHKKKAGDNAPGQRPKMDGHAMQKPADEESLAEEIVENTSQGGVVYRQGSHSSLYNLDHKNSILMNGSGPIINDATSLKRLNSKKGTVKFGKVDVIDYSTTHNSSPNNLSTQVMKQQRKNSELQRKNTQRKKK